MGRSDEQVVRRAVEAFLTAVASNDLDAIEKMVLPEASVG